MRELEAALKAAGLGVSESTTEKSEDGPATFMMTDQDGHAILVDQHR